MAAWLAWLASRLALAPLHGGMLLPKHKGPAGCLPVTAALPRTNCLAAGTAAE